MISTFEGAEINGKQFPFVRVTVAKQVKIIKKFKPTIFNAIAERFFPEGNNKRMWKRVRSVAFVKDWKWKYLRIVPKELRCSEISINMVGGLEARFFAYVREMVKEHDGQLLSATYSKIESEPTK